jgi:hypothetical protein
MVILPSFGRLLEKYEERSRLNAYTQNIFRRT